MAGGANGRVQPGFASGGSGGTMGVGGYGQGGMRSPKWDNAGYPDSGWGRGAQQQGLGDRGVLGHGLGGRYVQNPGMGGHMVGPEWDNARYPDSGWGGQHDDMGSGGVAGVAPGVESTETAQSDPWAGISQGRLSQAQRFANAGQFGRAKQQIGLGGGNWDDVGGLLRTEAAADDNYGGDWNWGGASDADVAQAQRFANAGMMGQAQGVMGDNWNNQMQSQLSAGRQSNPYVKGQSMGFDWGDATAGRLAEAKKLAAGGKMGQAKAMYQKGGGKWSPSMHGQFKAWQKGNA